MAIFDAQSTAVFQRRDALFNAFAERVMTSGFCHQSRMMEAKIRHLYVLSDHSFGKGFGLFLVYEGVLFYSTQLTKRQLCEH